nr:hypothetical protein [Sphingomonas sp.]
MSVASKRTCLSFLTAAGIVSFATVLVSACSPPMKSSQQCWSTEVLRVQVRSAVYDLPAAMRPNPSPTRAEGLFYPHYKPGDPSTRSRLLWCQDKAHVPLRVKSFSLDLSAGHDANPIELLNTSELSRSLPDQRTSAGWKIRPAGKIGRDATSFDISDGRSRHAKLWCQQITAIQTSTKTALCRVEVAVGDDVALFIAFNGDGLDPPRYLKVIESAARLIDGLRMGREDRHATI